MFNEAAPTPLLYSPSSSLVFARRKRSAFKGPMIHTANLMVSGGVPASQYSQVDYGTEGSVAANAVRPAARKSQIIEEEEDLEEYIEEVDTFSGLEDDPGSPVDLVKPDDYLGLEHMDGSPPEPTRKLALAPAPDFDPSPRPPRSSSLSTPPFSTVAE